MAQMSCNTCDGHMIKSFFRFLRYNFSGWTVIYNFLKLWMPVSPELKRNIFYDTVILMLIPFVVSPTVRPNHCGRHLGKINGNKSICVLTWRCIQDEFYVIFMQPCLNKLLQSQAEVCVLVVNANQVYQSSVWTIHRPSYFSQVAVLS